MLKPRAHRLTLGLTLLWVATLLSLPVVASNRLAIIIDDIGYNLTLGKRTADLSGDFTLAVLPFTPHGIELAERAHRSGKEIMLHAPMSNQHNYPLGRGGLTSGMQRGEFLAVLRQNLANIPHIKGLNNHMGSQLTEQAEPMSWLMEELQQRQLYFVDSRTSAQTQALAMAEKIHLPSRKRDVFLDDERTTSNIKYQLIRALKLAQQHGSAIAIGHPYPETLHELEQLQSLLDHYQVQLVKASQLMPHAQPLNNTKQTRCIAPPMGLWPQIWLPIDPFSLDLVFKPLKMAH
ncbi:divergent polysaccharide deacetylase family protein [Cellvibrio sp. OA-2007]|uniref:divergent polysaccharide deacetylase family protein n=1 Tax=Cellvibrio sp. OA-2007 TaxID=529823 RepID=UPI000B1336ED|nr:divergent polysaccharide deacetylase family protein [Cellvibrio sp. OA-2007]